MNFNHLELNHVKDLDGMSETLKLKRLIEAQALRRLKEEGQVISGMIML